MSGTNSLSMSVFDFVKPAEESLLATVCQEWRGIFTAKKKRKRWDAVEDLEGVCTDKQPIPLGSVVR